jgi:hypothetical protein
MGTRTTVYAGGGTRTRMGIALRCLRPLRLPFRHSGQLRRTQGQYRASPGGYYVSTGPRIATGPPG